MVIETDGGYQQVDSLKVAYDGAPETGMNVFYHSLDLVAQHPAMLAREHGLAGLCRTCQECPVVSSCGGGLYTHRYRAGSGFANPSVYCADLFRLIWHISHHQPDRLAAEPATPRHVVSQADFRAMAAGFGDAAAVTSLIQAQRSLLRMLLGLVYQRGLASPRVAEPVRNQLRAAWSVLSSVERARPEAVADTLRHPYVRAWAVRCLEQLTEAAPGPDSADPARKPGPADLGPAWGRSPRWPRSVPGWTQRSRFRSWRPSICPQSGGWCSGQSRAPAGQPDPDTAEVSVTANALTIQVGASSWTFGRDSLLAGEPGVVEAAGNSRSVDWQPVRWLRAPGWQLALEDTDPYRDCHSWPTAGRLGRDETARWRSAFHQAWREIEGTHPSFASGLATGVTTLTPLASPETGPEVSAVARQASGAVAASGPVHPALLARLLIKQFQAGKLDAILDLFDLCDPADDNLYRAPWNGEMLPLEGLLRGAYQRLAMTHFWRTRLHVATRAAEQGEGAAAVRGSANAHQRGPRYPAGLRGVDLTRQAVRRRDAPVAVPRRVSLRPGRLDPHFL